METQRYASNAKLRHDAWEAILLTNIDCTLQSVGLRLPDSQPAEFDSISTINKPLQTVLSEYVRRTRIPLPAFVELLRGQTSEDFRPNQNMIPDVLVRVCHGYEHLPCLLDIPAAGVQVPLSNPLPPQTTRPPNHRSALDRYNVLARRSIVVDEDVLGIWHAVHINPFGVVDKENDDPETTGRVVHDLLFPVNRSLNDCTDADAVCEHTFEHCDAIAAELVDQQRRHPNADVLEQAGDVSSAYRHLCIHSHCAHLFGGRLTRDNVLVVDMAAAFGWSGSPGNYGTVGSAISFIHRHTTNTYNPSGFFSYH
ncbi:hypothetical protein PHMEG_0004528 [Phytophthora megakarya]|uniref:Uncharacterized protein n=1 Tax=Phytophthora megakarya TaxID=4795 RepID=A0A225WTS5_9STRA|nr:hypothetical protein PHMEG_0004528 [Phytophthora megakarya]